MSIRGTDAMDRPVDETPTGFSRKRVLAIAGAATIALLFAAAVPAVRRWSSADTAVDLERLRLAKVTRGDLESDVAVQGKVVAANHPRLYSPAQGIVAVHVRPGEPVKRGQLLAEVTSPELQSELLQERARLQSLESELGRAGIGGRQRGVATEQESALLAVQLAAAQRELERAQKLRAEGLFSLGDLERAQVAVDVASLELEQRRATGALDREAIAFELSDRERQVERQRLVTRELERRTEQLRVVAPFDGLVASIDVEDRDAVAAFAPLLTIVDLSTFELEIAIPEAYADDVALDTPATVFYGGATLPGKVTRVSPEVTAAQVEGTVVFTGEPPAGLRQNQRLSVRLVFEAQRGVLKVPRGPFFESGGGKLVYVLENGLATLRPIETGATSIAEVEVRSGLAEGEQILLTDVRQFEGAKTVLVRD